MTGNLSIAYPDIGANAITIEPSGTIAEGFDKFNWFKGTRRYLRGRLATAAASPSIIIDLGTGYASVQNTCNHLIVARADLLKASGVTEILLDHSDNGTSWTNDVDAFMTDTMWGPSSADSISYGTATTAHRYWKIYFAISGTSAIECSAFQFGLSQTFRNSPSYTIERKPVDASWQAPAGDTHFVRTQSPRYKISLTWEGEYDATTKAFLNNIARWKDERRFFLYTTAQHQILDDKRVSHAKLESCEIETPMENWNRITTEWTEELG